MIPEKKMTMEDRYNEMRIEKVIAQLRFEYWEIIKMQEEGVNTDIDPICFALWMTQNHYDKNDKEY